MPRCFPAVFVLLYQLIVSAAAAQDAPRSECLAMANAAPRLTPVSLRTPAAKTDEVAITCAKDGYVQANVQRRPRDAGDTKDPVEVECYLKRK